MDHPTPPRPANPETRVQYLTREGCHLCEDALPTVVAAAQKFDAPVEVRDIDAEADLREDWNIHVPAIIVDGVLISTYRVTEQQMIEALAPANARASKGFRGAISRLFGKD